MTRKILTTQIKEEINYMFVCLGVYPEEQKGCSREQEEIVTYYALISKFSKTKWKNIIISWIDNENDMVPAILDNMSENVQQNSNRRLCGNKDQMVIYIINE